MQQVHAQPNALRGTLQLPFPSEESWKERLAKFGNNDYGLVACVEAEIVGMLSLMPTTPSPRRKHVGWLGMVVHDKWQSKGVGTALMKAAIDLADNWLNLKRLELVVYADNARAIALYERFGFEREGLNRAYAWRAGAYADSLMMARLRL